MHLVWCGTEPLNYDGLRVYLDFKIGCQVIFMFFVIEDSKKHKMFSHFFVQKYFYILEAWVLWSWLVSVS